MTSSTKRATRTTILAAAALLSYSTHSGQAFTIDPSVPRKGTVTTPIFRPLRHQPLPFKTSIHRSDNRILLRSTKPRIIDDEKTELHVDSVDETQSSISYDDDASDNVDFGIEDYDPSKYMVETVKNLADKALFLRQDSVKNSNEDKGNKKAMDTGEIIGLTTWMGALSTFLLVNNYIGPFPANIATAVPVETWGLIHGLSAMLFGGGIILTTCIEWLVVNSKIKSVWNFWFGKVPDLDSKIVLPALTGSILSGTALAVDHYDSLGQAPFHVIAALSTLLAFAGWWAVTDVTTQGRATEKIAEITEQNKESNEVESIPGILEFRKFSNLVSCGFVAALYFIMITKPGFTG